MLKHRNACGRSTCGTKICQTNTASRQLANQFRDNSNPRWLTRIPEVGLPRGFAVTISVLGSPLFLLLPAHSVFCCLCSSEIKPGTGGFLNSFCCIWFEIPLQVCGWLSFVLAEHTKLFFHLRHHLATAVLPTARAWNQLIPSGTYWNFVVISPFFRLRLYSLFAVT